MTSASRTTISALPRGHEFPSATFTVTTAAITQYLIATRDETDYGDAVPPLAAVALGLTALQEHLSLPGGSLHTGQEVEQMAIARAGEPLTLTGRIAQRSERQGFVASVIEFEIATAAAVAVRARTTILAPGEPA